MTEMDSLCECFYLTQAQLGQIMKMSEIQLAQWQTGEKNPNIIKICRLFFFLIRHYTRYFHHDLIAKEYRRDKVPTVASTKAVCHSTIQTTINSHANNNDNQGITGQSTPEQPPE
ncbi:hypothetical protein [Shewanella surugensis]|uniref:XRE family transcriptional regulator n=1 Tax=Shewanella surugensis TaxID=212020 RepID=A0ABT0L924_9GAMM|nr:hypothetical protein [Shewanella surugensis]MCL1123852.1 hypothetical protein [Shewanella surugensis]